jgi:hypothetical protein
VIYLLYSDSLRERSPCFRHACCARAQPLCANKATDDTGPRRASCRCRCEHVRESDPHVRDATGREKRSLSDERAAVGSPGRDTYARAPRGPNGLLTRVSESAICPGRRWSPGGTSTTGEFATLQIGPSNLLVLSTKVPNHGQLPAKKRERKDSLPPANACRFCAAFSVPWHKTKHLPHQVLRGSGFDTSQARHSLMEIHLCQISNRLSKPRCVS